MAAALVAPTASLVVTSVPHNVGTASASSLASVLPFLLPFCKNDELNMLGLVDKESEALCDTEWRQRVVARFGPLRFATQHWRKVFKLRAYLQRKVVENVSARVYLMNTRGETTCFSMDTGKSMMCSRERAIVYNRCERMFDLSLRINRSIQEISALIGMVSVDEARGLLNEHINLMASVASLRSSLMFESELFQVFPAPVLLDANTLLRGTFHFPDAEFLDSTTVMMQIVMKLHELSGMTIHIDDNTLRYRLQEQEMCVNALVSNTYLLYLFNPLQFRPMDWTYEAILYVGETRCPLPMQREGVFLNSNSLAMRVFLSYGKMPERHLDGNAADSDIESDDENDTNRRDGASDGGTRGSEDSDPLGIAYDGEAEVFSFLLMATNRITKESREIANKATCFSLIQSANTAQVTPSEATTDLTSATQRQDEEQPADPSAPEKLPRQPATPGASQERHVHLPYDAMICYCFSEDCTLQYVEFAIGFEALLHRLGVSPFLPAEAFATKAS